MTSHDLMLRLNLLNNKQERLYRLSAGYAVQPYLYEHNCPQPNVSHFHGERSLKARVTNICPAEASAIIADDCIQNKRYSKMIELIRR